MKSRTMLGAALLAAAAAGSALADPAYSHPGSVNPASYTFEAVATGEVYAYFLSEDAYFTDLLGMSTANSTAPIGHVGLDNQTSHRGQRIDLGHVTAGEVVTFFIRVVDTGLTFSSQVSENPDDSEHVFSTTYAGSHSPYIPKGVFLAFEDLETHQSDHDYNDTTFVVTNVRAVPEPAGVAMMLAGLGIVGAAARRRRR